MLGAAWQQGLVPVTSAALMRAIELNGVAIEQNKQAFASGRLAAADRDFATSLSGQRQQGRDADEIISRRVRFPHRLSECRLCRSLPQARQSKSARPRNSSPGSRALTSRSPASLFKLMAYKDEYEVARLHMETGFLDKLRQEFEGDFTVKYHLAPPILLVRQGRPRPAAQASIRAMGADGIPAAGAAQIPEGHALDVFGYSHERQMERGLIDWYEKLVADLTPWISPDTIQQLDQGSPPHRWTFAAMAR